MTKRDLIEALEPYSDDAEIFTQFADATSGALEIHGVEDYFGDILIYSDDCPDYTMISEYADAYSSEADKDELECLRFISSDANKRWKEMNTWK